MNVREFMTGEPVTCGVDTSLQDVSALMAEHGVGCILALEDGKLAGLITDRQLALAIGEGTESTAPASSIMTEQLVSVTQDMNVFEVLDTMRGAGLPKRVPVINGEGQLIGLVSIDDIAVLANDLVQKVLHNYTHTALDETKVPTGAKRLQNKLRAPSRSKEQDPPGLMDPVTVPHTEREHEARST